MKSLKINSLIKVNQIILMTMMMIFTTTANAGYASGLEVMRMRVHDDGEVYFGTSVQPTGTCSNWGEYFKFNHTTAEGKSLLSTLLSAKASGMKIAVWYVESTAPGTDQSTGCTNDSIALITGIGLP